MGAIQNSLNSVVGSLAGAAYAGKKLAAEQGQATELKKINEDAEKKAEQEELESKANISMSSAQLEKNAVEEELSKITQEDLNKDYFGRHDYRSDAARAYEIAMQRAEQSRLKDPTRNVQYKYAKGDIKSFADYKKALTEAYLKQSEEQLATYARGYDAGEPGEFEYDLANLQEEAMFDFLNKENK